MDGAGGAGGSWQMLVSVIGTPKERCGKMSVGTQERE